jgi:hypothetical protein
MNELAKQAKEVQRKKGIVSPTETEEAERIPLVRTFVRVLEHFSAEGIALSIKREKGAVSVRSVVYSGKKYHLDTPAPAVLVKVVQPELEDEESSDDSRPSALSDYPGTDLFFNQFVLPKSNSSHIDGTTLEFITMLQNCNFVKLMHCAVLGDRPVHMSGKLLANENIASFIKEKIIPIDLAQPSEVANEIGTIFSSLTSVYKHKCHAEIDIKLNYFYLAGLMEALSNFLRDSLLSENPIKKPVVIDQEVNAMLLRVVGGKWSIQNKGGLTQNMFDHRIGDGEIATQSPKYKQNFRAWKSRIMVFYHICKAHQFLLFTDIPFSTIARDFPEISLLQKIFRVILKKKKDYPTFIFEVPTE